MKSGVLIYKGCWRFPGVNTNGPFEKLQAAEKTKDAATSSAFGAAGREARDFNDLEPTPTPKPSQRQYRTERPEIEFETDMDSEPSGQQHRDREGRGSMWHGSATRHYKHNVRLFNSTARLTCKMELVCITQFFPPISDSKFND